MFVANDPLRCGARWAGFLLFLCLYLLWVSYVMFLNSRIQARDKNIVSVFWIVLLCVLLSVSACGFGASEEAGATAVPPSNPSTTPASSDPHPIIDGPKLLRNDISLRKIVDAGSASIRLALHPADNEIYYLNPSNGIFRVALTEPFSAVQVVATSDITTDGFPTGMAFGPDGALYIVANRMTSEVLTQGVIFKGVEAIDGTYDWDIFAESEPYPASGTQYDHSFNGIVVTADNQWLFVNSGSRTDHGEVQDNGGAFPNTRGVDMTARIFRIPVNSEGLLIPNDEAAQIEQGLLFAKGMRNAYDLAIAPNGDLFAIDNGPDADFPDELNWIREGGHYGFPWRFGNEDNPQQFADYDASADGRLSQDFLAVQLGTYANDPDFPPAPGSFTDPVLNLGPAAAQYRGEDGQQHDAAAEGKPLYTFTPHRSPLGLVFSTDSNMPADLRGDGEVLSAFVLSWGSAGGTLSDSGQDLLHLALTKRGDNYEAVTTQIAVDFKNPIDAVMIENRLYVLEYGADGTIWELTFE